MRSIGHEATSSAANARHAERVWADAALSKHLDKLSGLEALNELTFQQLLDLQDEASEDDSFDTFNDIARELKHRRDDAKTALTHIFIVACDNGGTVPAIIGQRLVQADIAEHVRETMSTNWGTELGSELVLHPHARGSVIARLAADFVENCCEDLLRAGWTE